jgi:micrococcal nuclease
MRLSLAILLILFGLRFPAAAEPLRVSVAEDAVTLRLADKRIVLLDGLLAPDADDDGERSEADKIAAAALARLIESAVGQTVRLNALLEAPDRWNRIPADVHLQNSNVWLQERMLQEGLARIGPCPLGGPERLKMLRAAEASARTARRGLWRIGAYQIRDAMKPIKAHGFVLVAGLPLESGGGRSVRYLNFAKDWRQDFTLRATKAVARRLAKANLGFDAVVERKLLVRGWLVWRNGPMLNITCPQQTEALDP